jgi:hypothetical protein
MIFNLNNSRLCEARGPPLVCIYIIIIILYLIYILNVPKYARCKDSVSKICLRRFEISRQITVVCVGCEEPRGSKRANGLRAKADGN